ncbi:MAG TPA: ubiquinone biosynthesis protein UbiE [Chloroflexi bacterium]|nr:ubiquinone biosynthesis protein UbiE [Chloroflexota bacterium]
MDAAGPAGQDQGMVSFDNVADEYDAGRPPYPAEVYDALGPLAGSVVLEGGAGTGIATRQLLERGTTVVPFDIGAEMLHGARARTSELAVVVADGAALPFRDACADLICFAQAWHWLDEQRRCVEAFRVLRRHGRWAGWWSHARADSDSWFDEYWSLIEASCVGTHRGQRDTDWGAGLAESGLFAVSDRLTIPWTRDLAVDVWLTDQASHSYVAALPEPERSALLDGLRSILHRQFADGAMSVPYETWLWIAEAMS